MLPQKPWQQESIWLLLGGLVGGLLWGMLTINLLKYFYPTIGGSDFMVFVIATLSFHGIGLALVWLLLREHAVSWSEAFGFGRERLGQTLLLGAAVGVVMLPVGWSLSELSAWILTRIHLQPVMQPSVETLEHAAGWWKKSIFGAVAIVLAPAVEEMIFRGVLYPALKQAPWGAWARRSRFSIYRKFRRRGWRRGAIWMRWGWRSRQFAAQAALWSTSLFFAAMHANLLTFLPLTFLAVALALEYEITGNLLAPILTHSFFNGANFFWLITANGLRLKGS